MNFFTRTDTCLKTRQMRFSYTILFFIATTQIFSCSARPPNIDSVNSNGINLHYTSLHDKNSHKLEHQRSKRDNGVIKTQNELPSKTTNASDEISEEGPQEADNTYTELDDNLNAAQNTSKPNTDEVTGEADDFEETDGEEDGEEDDKTTKTYTEAKFDTTTYKSSPTESNDSETEILEQTPETEITTTYKSSPAESDYSNTEAKIAETTPETEIASTTSSSSSTSTSSPSPTSRTSVTPISSTTSSNTKNDNNCLEPKSMSSNLRAAYSFVILIPVSLLLL